MDERPPDHAEAITPGASRGAHPYRSFAIRLGLGVAILGFLLWHYNAGRVLAILARESLFYFAAAVVLYVAGQVMSAYRWKLMAGLLHLDGSFRDFLAYYFVGMFTNLFVPGLVGGDAARAFYLARRQHRTPEAFASAFADRGYGLLALVWFAAAVGVALNRGRLHQSVINTTLAVAALTFLGYASSPWLARIIHLAPRPIRRAGGVVAPYLHRPLALLPPMALSVVLQASLAVCQYLLALGLGLDAPLSLFVLVVPIANVFASLPITLNGLGVRETAYLMLFGMAGMARNDAIALGLLWFAATMLGGLTGAVAFVTTELPAAQHTGAAMRPAND
jgi:glycosyltransferase 2 family protein